MSAFKLLQITIRGGVSDNQRYKAIGNCWTIDIISHILKNIDMNIEDVLSCFDGISCGQLALERAGIKINNYYASEIDKYAIQITMKNFPNTKQIGDIAKISYTSINGSPVGLWDGSILSPCNINLLIGGSPCQGFSFAGKQLNFDDSRSKLFFEYVRLLKEIRVYNPDVLFLLENVKMKKEYQDVISEALGVQPIEINSALVSAQNRKRLYWTNIKGVTQPEDKGILLKDILDTNYDFDLYQKTGKQKPSTEKSGCLTGTAHAAGNHSQMDVIVKKNEKINYTITGRINIHINKFIRRYFVSECEKLQTMPIGYTSGVSESQRYKSLINGWTMEVIKHIFSFI